MLPIYWLVNMSLKTNQEILSGFSLVPQQPTLANYAVIFGDPSWYNGYINSIIYVVLNTVISVSVALPAAYAFSRYRFLGDKRSEEHTSELQSLMRISYAVFCLQKKKSNTLHNKLH